MIVIFILIQRFDYIVTFTRGDVGSLPEPQHPKPYTLKYLYRHKAMQLGQGSGVYKAFVFQGIVC